MNLSHLVSEAQLEPGRESLKIHLISPPSVPEREQRSPVAWGKPQFRRAPRAHDLPLNPFSMQNQRFSFSAGASASALFPVLRPAKRFSHLFLQGRLVPSGQPDSSPRCHRFVLLWGLSLPNRQVLVSHQHSTARRGGKLSQQGSCSFSPARAFSAGR